MWKLITTGGGYASLLQVKTTTFSIVTSYPGLPVFFNVSREKSGNVEKRGKAWVQGYLKCTA